MPVSANENAIIALIIFSGMKPSLSAVSNPMIEKESAATAVATETILPVKVAAVFDDGFQFSFRQVLVEAEADMLALPCADHSRNQGNPECQMLYQHVVFGDVD